MKFTAKKLRLILIGLLALLAVIFGVTALTGLGKLSDQSQKLVASKLESKKADAQLSALGIAKQQVEKYSYFNDVAKTVIPNDKDQAQAVLDIYQIAKEAGINISGITFPVSTLGGTSSVSATSKKATTTAISQAQPVPGIKGLYSLELTIDHLISSVESTDGQASYPKFIELLSKLERNRRTSQITNVNIAPPSPNSKYFSFNLTVKIFMRPQK